MAYQTQEGMYSVGDLGQTEEAWYQKKLVGPVTVWMALAAVAAVGVWQRKRIMGLMGIGDTGSWGDTGCGCGE